MNFIKYLLNNFIILIYLLISCLATFTISLVSFEKFDTKIFFTLLLYFLIMRVTDDIFDYEKDREIKKQYLNVKNLMILNGIFILLNIVLNILFYGVSGIINIGIILLIILGKRIKLLQLFVGLSIYYYIVFVNEIAINNDVIYASIVIVFLSIMYGVVKRSKKI